MIISLYWDYFWWPYLLGFSQDSPVRNWRNPVAALSLDGALKKAACQQNEIFLNQYLRTKFWRVQFSWTI